MPQINTLGPVGFNPTGEYDNTKEYERLDVVLYQGSSYVALQTVQGIVPTNAEYWQKLASGGASRDEVPLIFNTVAEMKSAEDLAIGDTVQTLGYYEVNDGGGSTYKITNEQSENEYQEELENGLYASLIIKNDTVSVKQFGAKGDGISDDTQSIQNALKYNGNNIKNIFFNNAIGYVIKNTLYLYSNTNIDFNNQHILIKNTELLILNNIIAGKAQYIENITLKNGYFDGTTNEQERYCNTLKFGLLRVNNLIVENNTFYKISNERHTFDMGGCTNVIIKNNYWHNVYNAEGNRQAELVQLDNAFYSGVPYWDVDSELYNNQGCKNVKIIGNRFEQDDSNNGYINAIGTHSAVPNNYHEDIYIANNIFDDPGYGNIKFVCWKNVVIENNIFLVKNVQTYADESGRANIICVFGTYDLEEETSYYPSENITIAKNTFKSLNQNNYILGIRLSGNSVVSHNNINVIDNTFEGTYVDNENQGTNFISLAFINNAKILDNTITKAKNAIYGTESKNVLVANNILKNCRTYDGMANSCSNIYFNKNLFLDSDNEIIELNDTSFVISLNNEDFVTLSEGVTLGLVFDDIISKEGSFANINTLLNVTIPSDNSFHTIMNVNSPFRPLKRKSFACYGALNNGYNLKYQCTCMIETGGDVKIRNDSGTAISLLNINGIYSLK